MTRTQLELRQAYHRIEQWERTEQRDALIVIGAAVLVAALLVVDFMLGFAFSDPIIDGAMALLDWVER